MRMLGASIVCLGLFAPSAPAWGADEWAGRLADLGANQWLYANPQPSQRLVLKGRNENSPVAEITTREPAFREYTSPAWGDDELVYFGGGHGGYCGNDVEVYDPAANRWRQCYRPVCPPKDDSTYYSGGSERCYVDPQTGAAQPYVLHGYARTSFDPALQRYVCTAMFATKTERDASSGTWQITGQAFSYIAFDTKSARWELLAAVPDALKPGSTSLCYDPDQGGMLAFSERAAFLYRQGAWQEIGQSDTPLAASGGAAGVYLPDRKQHLLAVLGHGGPQETGRLALFDCRDRKGLRGPALPPDLAARVAPGTGGFNLILACDSVYRRVVFLSANAEMRPDAWVYDPAAETWQALPAPPSAPKMVGVFEPGRGRAPLHYDAKRNVFFAILRNGDSAETWAYRLAK